MKALTKERVSTIGFDTILGKWTLWCDAKPVCNAKNLRDLKSWARKNGYTPYGPTEKEILKAKAFKR